MFLNLLKWSFYIKVILKIINGNIIKMIKISKMIKYFSKLKEMIKSNLIKMLMWSKSKWSWLRLKFVNWSRLNWLWSKYHFWSKNYFWSKNVDQNKIWLKMLIKKNLINKYFWLKKGDQIFFDQHFFLIKLF